MQLIKCYIFHLNKIQVHFIITLVPFNVNILETIKFVIDS